MKTFTRTVLILAATAGLGACSSINPWNDSRMVQMDRQDPEDRLKVPRYMLEAQPSNVGVGEGRADDAQTSRALAAHYARVDLCGKLGVTANSVTRTTAAQNTKGVRSATSVTGSVASETVCAADVRSPEVLDTTTVQSAREFITWMRVSSDSVEPLQTNTFTDADAKAAQQLRVR